MNTEQPYQYLPQAKSFQVSGTEDEGGLDFARFFGAIRRQAFAVIGTTALLAVIGYIKAATDTPIYKAQFELLAEPLSLESQVISSTTPEALSSRQEVVAVVPNEAKLRVLKSPRILESLIDELRQQYPDISYQDVVSNLRLDVDDKNYIVRVEYKNSNPKQVHDVLMRVADAYLQYSLEFRQSEISKGLDFVEEQLPRLRSRVDELQGRLQELRQENNLIDPVMEAEQLSEQIGTFEQQRLLVKGQLNEAQLLAEDLERELSRQSVEKVASSVLFTPRYEALLNHLQEIDTQIAKESATFSDTSPQLETLQQERLQVILLLREEAARSQREIASKIRELQVRDRALNQTVARLQQRSKQLSEITRQYSDLQRELEIASNNLNQFLTKREALGVDVAQSEGPWELLTPPGEPIAYSASVKRNLLLGTTLGILLGTGVALVIDRLSNLLHSTKEIQEVAGLPLLGIIPFDKALLTGNPSQLSLPESDSREQEPGTLFVSSLASPAVESFRSLYANIRLLNPDTPIHSLVVSSAIPGEGKSTIALHLARAAAAMGRQVLFVDADLRSSEVHKSIAIPSGLGLTNIILQDNLEADRVIQQSQLEESLFILPSGQIPPDPGKLLASEKMQHLMEELQDRFELVIYDSTIVSGFSDAHLLATATDGLLLVTGIGRLKRSVLEGTMEKLKISRTPILGVVVNRDKDPLRI